MVNSENSEKTFINQLTGQPINAITNQPINK